MKIILVHGEDVKKINDRVALFVDSARKRGWEIVRVNKKDKINLGEVLNQDSLFSSGKLFVVEGIKSISKKDIKWLNEHKNTDYTLIVQNEGNASQTDIKKIPFTKVEKYEVSVNVFKFTDSVKKGNAKNSLQLLNELKQKEPLELIVAMLARHLADLYRASSGYNIKGPSWKKSSLTNIANDFGREEIVKMINELSIVDYKSKTGQTEPGRALDLYIIKHLDPS